MNKILDKATAHFRNKISGDLLSIDVPEWECKIYFKASLTLKEQSKLIELANQGKSVEALVESLILKARNEDGSKMFAPMDRVAMLNEIDPNVIVRVVGEMNEISSEGMSEDSVIKN
jgi:hypothetical protein